MAVATVGLTGGIASGKSSAARYFQALGVPVCDADQVAREVVDPGTEALERIFQTLGPEYRASDGRLDRRRLRERVFQDPAALRTLESITHPAIRQGMLRWRDQQTADYCILDVAILFESGFDQLVDRSLVIDCPEANQIQRVMARDHCDEASARRILANQMSRSERLTRATDVIRNSGSLGALEAAVAEAHHCYLAWANGEWPAIQPFDLPDVESSATISARSKPQ